MLTNEVFKRIEYYESIPSTNDRAKELIRFFHDSPDTVLPCLIVAKRQSAGRGRGNKSWWSGDGSLLMSIGIGLCRETITRDDLPELSIRTAKVIVEVLRKCLPQACHIEIHPPNDVYADGKKISGILIESLTPQSAVIGIGLNVNNRLQDIPGEFREELEKRSITSIIEILGQHAPTHLTVDILIEEIVYLLFSLEKTKQSDKKLVLSSGSVFSP